MNDIPKTKVNLFIIRITIVRGIGINMSWTLPGREIAGNSEWNK
jgi:hypothetical protein